MGDEGEKQIEIWKVKRVSAPCLILLLGYEHTLPAALPDARISALQLIKAFRSGKRERDIHDQSHYASERSGEACDCYTMKYSSEHRSWRPCIHRNSQHVN